MRTNDRTFFYEYESLSGYVSCLDGTEELCTGSIMSILGKEREHVYVFTTEIPITAFVVELFAILEDGMGSIWDGDWFARAETRDETVVTARNHHRPLRIRRLSGLLFLLYMYM